MDLPQWELQDAFSLFAPDADRCIPARQIGEVLRALGQNPTEADIKKLGYSARPDERINFETFLPILHEVSKAKNAYRTEDFMEGFRHFDKDQTGTIQTAQLRHLLTTLGDRLNEEEFDQLISGLEDGQGMVNYESFIRNVING